MKVLMINVCCGIRSTGRICTDLATALEEQGHEVRISYGRFEVPEQFQKYAVRIGTDFDVKLHGLKARLFDGMGFGSRKATERFIEWVKEYDPDVIHLHNIHGYYINIEVLFDYLRSCGKKIIWTLHDCWAFTGHTAYCDVIECKRWEKECHDCPLRKEYPMSLLDNSKSNWNRKKNILTGINNLTVITPSNWLKSLVEKSFLMDYPAYVIHNGIDTTVFSPISSNFKYKNNIEDKIMLLGVATSWDENKGYSDFIKISQLLGNEYQVVLVGLTEVQKKELPNNIIGITRTNSTSELVEIYSSADYMLNLSKTENYPTVNLESICCGTPVITYDAGGSKESIDNSNGVVIGKGDVNAVVVAIKSRITKINKEYKEFDKNYSISSYLKLYNSL